MSSKPFVEKTPTPPLYAPGKIMVINRQFVGMVLSSHWAYCENSYRMIVDSKDIIYRFKQKETQEQDYFLFKEDENNLLFITDAIAIANCSEKHLLEISVWEELYGKDGDEPS